VYQEIATHQLFALSAEPILLNNKCFLIPTDDLYLLGLLNAGVGWHFLHNTASKLQQGAFALQTPYMEQLPIPDASPADRAIIEGLVRRLLDLHAGATPPEPTAVAALEVELNARVYALYDLTPAEIALIEETTAV